MRITPLLPLRRRALATLGLAGLFASSLGAAAPDLSEIIADGFAFAETQYSGMLQLAESRDGNPRTLKDGEVVFVRPEDWTSGFFPGGLWLIYEQNGRGEWAAAAARHTEKLERLKDHARTHDLGFMLYCSYGNGYRLLEKPAYRNVLVAGARTLATRFKPTVGAIRSWDHGAWDYPVIIDNMMNLELLIFAAEQTGESHLRDVAVSHADVTLKNHFRPDHSSYHVVGYDPETGAVKVKQTHKGHADDSAWARGQAWGLYGYAMMHRLTKDPAYLAQARRIADFMIGHPRLPADKIPYWDFDAPDIPNAPRDASAAAIMASALIELSGFVDAAKSKQYLDIAEQQVRAMSSPAYRPKAGEFGNFLLMHCTGHMPRKGEIDTALIYGDYYYLETLKRFKDLLASKK